MKKSILFSISLIILTLGVISTVAAETAILTVHNGGNIWTIDASTVTFDVTQIDVETLQPYYYSGPDKIYVDTIQKTTIKDGKLLIFFYGVDIPKTADAVGVEGLLLDGTPFVATGPGFAWGRR